MKKILKNNKLTQNIKQATRVTPAPAILLDFIITNKVDTVQRHDVVPQAIADHGLISVEINIKKPEREPVKRTFRQLSGYAPETLSSILMRNAEQLNNIFTTDDVNEQVKIFTDTFIESLDECAPFVTRTIRRPYAHWMNDEILQAIQLKKITYKKKYKHDRVNAVLLTEYKAHKKRVLSIMIINNTNSSYDKEKLQDSAKVTQPPYGK